VVAAGLTLAAAGSYLLIVSSSSASRHMGRISIFLPGFIGLLTLACVVGAFARRPDLRGALLAMTAVGSGFLGPLWIWIELFVPATGALLVIAAVVAGLAATGAVMTRPRRLLPSLSALIGAGAAALILALGLAISIAPACGAAGSVFHIDSWHQPWSAAYVCGDGRLSFEFWPR
jgi:hypothetical protein